MKRSFGPVSNPIVEEMARVFGRDERNWEPRGSGQEKHARSDGQGPAINGVCDVS
jgi:hypothetical protein